MVTREFPRVAPNPFPKMEIGIPRLPGPPFVGPLSTSVKKMCGRNGDEAAARGATWGSILYCPGRRGHKMQNKSRVTAPRMVEIFMVIEELRRLISFCSQYVLSVVAMLLGASGQAIQYNFA